MGITNLEDMINPKIKEPSEATFKPVAVNDEFFNQPEFEGSVLQQSMVELEEEMVAELSKQLSNELDQMMTLPSYLLSDPEIVGYPDLEFQEQIYSWVNDSIPTQGYTIKDLGCGRGDFFGYISKREAWEEKFKDIHYFGIELNPNLCTVAKQKYPEINVLNNDYFDTDIQTDYTVCIGTLGDNLGQDKWENFNKTLNWAINNTKISVIFILQRDCYGNEGFFDYPFGELFANLDPNLKFKLDYSELEDIYKLTVHIDGFNS